MGFELVMPVSKRKSCNASLVHLVLCDSSLSDFFSFSSIKMKDIYISQYTIGPSVCSYREVYNA